MRYPACTYSNMTGEATAAIYAGMTVHTVLGVCRLSVKLLSALYGYFATRREDPVPPAFLSAYGSDIRLVVETLVAAGYELSTVIRYARVVGELMIWMREQQNGKLTAVQLERFFDHLVSKGRADAELRFGARSDSDGRAVRYIAFHAVRTVLDRCFQMEVTSGMSAPPRPDRTAPAALESTAALYGDIRDDREQMLLILINGLSVMPAQAAGLRWNDFDSDFGTLRLRLGRPDRQITKTVQVVSGYRKAIRACWKRARRGGADSDSFIFPSTRGTEPDHVTVRTLQNVLRRMADRGGIDQHLTLTALRIGGAWMPSHSQWYTPDAAAPRGQPAPGASPPAALERDSADDADQPYCPPPGRADPAASAASGPRADTGEHSRPPQKHASRSGRPPHGRPEPSKTIVRHGAGPPA